MENEVSYAPPKTAAGQAWLKAYLHPPTGGAVEGIPDHSVQSSIGINWKNEFNIVAPTAPVSATWSALLISMPNPRYPLWVLKWTGDTPAIVGDINSIVYENTNFDWGASSTNWNNNTSRFRAYASSLTAYFDASDLYNQGRAYVAQGTMGTPGRIVGTSVPADVGQDIHFGSVPMVASNILQMSDKYYTGLAKEGSYSVQGFVDPVMNYVNGFVAGFVLNANVQTLAGGATVAFAIPTNSPTFFSAFSVSYHLFTGLLPQATLQAKRIHGWEIIPNAGSAWAPFATGGPCPDASALEAAAIQRHGGQDGYPSAANDLAAFWNAAKSLGPVLSAAYKVAKPALKVGLNTLPAGGLLNQVLEGVESLAMSRTPKKQKVSATAVKKRPLLKAQSSEANISPLIESYIPKGLSKSARKNLHKKLRKELNLMS